jgi:hypothetical protein
MKERTKKLLSYAPIRVTYGIIAAIVMKLPRIAFFILSFYAIFWVGQQLYFKYAPADHFLDFYYAKVDDTPIGTEPLMTLCRRVNTEGIKIAAVRSFIQCQSADSERGEVVAEYQFDAGIEKLETNCQTLRLGNQPQVVGSYRVHTEFEFYINGNRKSGAYDTNKYNMTPLTLSVDEQIDELQREIRLLEAQVKALRDQNGETSTQTPATPSQAPQGAQTQPSGNVSQNPSQSSSGSSSGGGSNNSVDDAEENETPSQPTCIVPIIGNTGLLCGGDGLLRL